MKKNNCEKIINYDLQIENEIKTDKFYIFLINNKIKLFMFFKRVFNNLLFNKNYKNYNNYINKYKKSILINCYF